MKLGILASGNLGLNIIKHLSNLYQVEMVFTDKKSVAIIDFCLFNNIPCFTGNPRNKRSSVFISDKKIDILISVNYLFLIEQDLISLPNLIAFNVHGSLLPKYRGRTPHVWSIINNERKTGVTAHIIEEGCDTGGILEQIEIDIDEDDTGASLLKKYERLYPVIIDSVLNKIKNNSLSIEKQDEKYATYFGKRTPEDGGIDWNWQKERIRNWVRAQTEPYPGAFTFFDGKKIVIDEVKFSDYGFNYSLPNGSVVSLNPILIKTPNGLVEITKFRDVNKFKIGEILGK